MLRRCRQGGGGSLATEGEGKGEKGLREEAGGSEFFREDAGKDVAGSDGVFLSLSALNCLPCLTCFRHEEGIS